MNDDFDHRTPAQRRADDDAELRRPEATELDRQLDDAQAALQADLDHLEHTDPVGLVWFGHDAEWMRNRLNDARLDRRLEAKRP